MAVALNQRQALEEAFTDLGVIHERLSREARDVLLDTAMHLTEVLAQDIEFDFGTTDLSRRMHAHAKQLRRHRSELRPPPLSYLFFQRKLGGAFLLSRKLGASVNCHRLLYEMRLLEPAVATSQG
jgi:hypothetical protein